MGIHMGEPVSRERLPILHRRVENENERLESRLPGCLAGDFVKFSPDQHSRHIKVGRDVDAALLETGDQVIELICGLRRKAGARTLLFTHEFIVVVVDADRIKSPGRHAIGQFLGMFSVEILGGAAEISTVKADRFLRAVAEDKAAVPDLYRAVFSGRGVQPPRKIKDGILFDIAAAVDRLPFLPGSDVVWFPLVTRQRTVSHGGGDNSPDRLAGRVECNTPDRFVFERIAGAV
ncbi:hypothetical protein SDC9_148303 [bioreactor metagenome]|uniref:Uncharacterized protein n=1 Tax=bioreactor metagenome TaxID=1076179 RepID=A0A645EIE6_9ZZZZ